MKALIHISYQGTYHKTFRALSPLITLLGQGYYTRAATYVDFFAAPGVDDSTVNVKHLEHVIRELAEGAPRKYVPGTYDRNPNLKREMAAWRVIARNQLTDATAGLLPY